MALGSEIDDAGDAAADRRPDRVPIADVSFDEAVARIRVDIFEIGEVARVSELVEVDDARERRSRVSKLSSRRGSD